MEKERRKKNVAVQFEQPIKLCGPAWHRLIIHPLPEAGGGRCSVKPPNAVPSTLGAMKPKLSLKSLVSTTGLDWASQNLANPKSSHLDWTNGPATLMPPLRSQAHVTKLGGRKLLA
uniref:Uncharacterized protein n=1 Tax=Manihot esculenta TaxID=3983 RepID=A0A199UBD5_MANES